MQLATPYRMSHVSFCGPHVCVNLPAFMWVFTEVAAVKDKLLLTASPVPTPIP